MNDKPATSVLAHPGGRFENPPGRTVAFSDAEPPDSGPPLPRGPSKSRLAALRFFGEALRQWRWTLPAVAGMAAAGMVLGWVLTDCAATATLIRNSPGGTGASRSSEALPEAGGRSRGAMLALMQSPDLPGRVASRLGGSVSPAEIAAKTRVEEKAGGELVSVTLLGRNSASATARANTYAEEALAYQLELGQAERKEAGDRLRETSAQVGRRLEEVHAKLAAIEPTGGLRDPEMESARLLRERAENESKALATQVQLDGLQPQIESMAAELAKHNPEALSIQAALNQDLTRFTEEHPRVKEKRAALAALRERAQQEVDTTLQGANKENAVANNIYLQLVGLRAQKLNFERQVEGLKASRLKLDAALADLSRDTLAQSALKSEYDALRASQNKLSSLWQEARLAEGGAAPAYRLLARATPDRANLAPKARTAFAAGGGGGLLGVLVCLAVCAYRKTSDGRIRSGADLAHATRLPLLASLGDVNAMSREERQRWALKTLAALKARLRPSGDGALSCGFISSTHGEGRTTWVNLLAEAACTLGYRVLVVSEREASLPARKVAPGLREPEPAEAPAKGVPVELATPAPVSQLMARIPLPTKDWKIEEREEWREAVRKSGAARGAAVFLEIPPASDLETILMTENRTQLIWLCGKDMASLAETRSQLETLRACQCELVGAVLNREAVPPWRRKLGLFTGALALVFGLCAPPCAAAEPPAAPPLVVTNDASAGEVKIDKPVAAPPAAKPAATNAVPATPAAPSAEAANPGSPSGLVSTNSVSAGQIRTNGVQAGLPPTNGVSIVATPANRPPIPGPDVAAPTPPAANQTAENAAPTVATTAPVPEVQPPAAPTNAVPVVTGGNFSSASSTNLAAWQQRLTLGPGDTISISLFDQEGTSRPGLMIGLDGRINYLQVQNFVAAGLTVEELREQLEIALTKYIRTPRVVVVPENFSSKRYYILGAVSQKGAFQLDHSVTILEALARAGGLATVAGPGGSSVIQADLSRSFLIQKGSDSVYRRLELDFEGMFLHGDLRQNITLSPDDFLFFPPIDLQEVYLLGEVKAPGPVAFTGDNTALRVVISKGGFTERAWRQRILVVRGSLNHPETFVINAAQILRGEIPDFKLKPRDIVYVNRKPWAKAQELLESALSDFLRSAVTTWSGQHIPALIKKPIL